MVHAGATLIVESGGTISGVTVSSGGVVAVLSGGSGSLIADPGAIVGVGSGEVYIVGVSAAHPVDVLSGGTFSGGAVSSGGKLTSRRAA